MLARKIEQVVRDYGRLRSVVPLGTLCTKKDYELAVEALDHARIKGARLEYF